MFEGIKDMGKLLKQAKEMKAKMKKVQDDLKRVKMTGKSRDQLVTAVITGELELVELTIEASLQTASNKQLVSSVKEAVNEAAKKSKDYASKALSDISSGMDLGGFDKMLGGA